MRENKQGDERMNTWEVSGYVIGQNYMERYEGVTKKEAVRLFIADYSDMSQPRYMRVYKASKSTPLSDVCPDMAERFKAAFK